MKNVHIIPTIQPSRLWVNNLYRRLELEAGNLIGSNTARHLYITNDEEVKKEDWTIWLGKDNQPFLKKVIDEREGEWLLSSTYDMWVKKDKPKKIILTTDSDLVKESVQAIDDKFLQWFCNNSSCEEVETYSLGIQNAETGESGHYKYEIIIPKEEFKQEIVGYRLKPSIDRMMVDGILKNAMPNWNDEYKSVYFIRGHVGGSLVAKLRELQVLDLWFTPIYENEEIKSDLVKEHHLDYYHKESIMSNKPKQETVEEAAETRFTGSDDITNYNLRFGFQEGAKWMQERMYSEEDLKNAFDSGRKFNSLDGIVDIHIVLPMGGDISDLQPLYPTFEDWFKNLKSKNENI